MGMLVMIEFLSIDGVMQGLGSPHEDTEGGFAHGGWGAPYALKATEAGDIAVLGSGVLCRQLLAEGLVDEVRLFLHPLLLGAGKRLFGELPAPRRLSLRSVAQTDLGTVALVYGLRS